jgi:NADH-quinone oxidoreductase subunit J
VERVTETILFWIFATLTLVGGASVVFTRNPINAAMSLVGSFFALAGLYLLLSAQLIAALQILVYAGAIMVLFLFVIMLLNLTPAELGRKRFGFSHLLGGATALAVTALLVNVTAHLRFPGSNAHTDPWRPVMAATDFGTVAAVGRALFITYTLPFEAVSLLLLAAILGAVVVAKGKM